MEPGLCHSLAILQGFTNASTQARGFKAAQPSAHPGPIPAQSSWKSTEIGFFLITDLKEALQKCLFSYRNLLFLTVTPAQRPVLGQGHSQAQGGGVSFTRTIKLVFQSGILGVSCAGPGVGDPCGSLPTKLFLWLFVILSFHVDISKRTEFRSV